MAATKRKPRRSSLNKLASSLVGRYRKLRVTATQGIRRALAPKTLGQRGEAAAARYLKRLGYIIVARSSHIRRGEIDLIAVDGRTIVFVEVKTRVSHDAGHPAEAVDRDKQHRLTRLAMVYLKRHHLLENPGPLRRDRDYLAHRRAMPHDRTFQKRLRANRHGADVLLNRPGPAFTERLALDRRELLDTAAAQRDEFC